MTPVSGKNGTGRVNSGWRVDPGLFARIGERAAARDMNRSRWLEEAALAHLERDPLIAAELASVLRGLLREAPTAEPYAYRLAFEALDRFEAVRRV